VAKAHIGDLEMAYDVQGVGEPLILIGGFTMTKEAWEDQVRALRTRFRVITMDNRGVGETTLPGAPFTIDDMARDTVGLLDALGVEAAHVFGVSMGGLIAQILLLDHPQRVKKAALGCTTHGGRHAVAPSAEVMSVLAQAADPALTPEEAYTRRAPVIFAPEFIRGDPQRYETVKRRALGHWPSPQGVALQFKALSVFNSKRRLGEIRHPVLVITGDEDRMMPPENSRLLAEGIAGAELYLVRSAGHMFFAEKPGEVNDRLTRFFQE
jgi:pimeloyl-ACP methyl ester carboxylesterase